MYIIAVVYPVGKPVNMEYYLGKHMPLVQKVWGPMGLKSYNVVKYTEGPYSLQTFLHWESKEVADATLAKDESKPVFGDIPNFYDGMPLLYYGDQISQVGW